jgi:hypothetical protein
LKRAAQLQPIPSWGEALVSSMYANHDGPTVPSRDCRRSPWNLYHTLFRFPYLGALTP